MYKMFFILLVLFVSSASAEDELVEKRTSFQRESLYELMAYGLGVAEGITDLGEKSYNKISGFEHGEKYSRTVVTETVNGITTKKFSGAVFPAELFVTKKNLMVPFGGTLSSLTVESVISSLGPPAEQSANELKYHVPSHMDDYILVFTFEKDKAKSISWVWFGI
jgi:hypothetical protein